MLCFSSSPPHLCAHVDSPSARDGRGGRGRSGGRGGWPRGRAGEGREGAGGFNTCLAADDLLPRFLPPSPPPLLSHPSFCVAFLDFEALRWYLLLLLLLLLSSLLFSCGYGSLTASCLLPRLSLLSSSTAPPPLILSLPHSLLSVNVGSLPSRFLLHVCEHVRKHLCVVGILTVVFPGASG